MSETIPGETPVERRLREMTGAAAEVRFIGWGPERRAAVDAGREALALLRRYRAGELNWMVFDGLTRALLARCEETR